MTSDLEKALQEIERLRQENVWLRKMLGARVSKPDAEYTQTDPAAITPNGRVAEVQRDVGCGRHGLSASARPSPIRSDSSTQEKIKLFQALFRGRDDVYALFWVNDRTGKKGYSPACEDPWSSRKGKPKKYLPLTDDVIRSHLSGEAVIGVYPLLRDDTCWFLACDFDKEGWVLDALAYLNIC